ncbi:MAG: MaoC family dehydratase N-terminal domain-containing protein [Betaproteobacteria bacterium]|nr:MaoC family dehydratase N-terminal domain-containing protein [Betaproteobacteria bacterium]
MGADLEQLKQWIGSKESDLDYVTVPAVHRLAATLDRDDPMPNMGDPLPIGWHQILFPRVVRHSQIGPDGHPQRGDFLPPVPLPRRMFAGKRTTFHADLQVGDAVRRDSVIKDVTIKQGRTGQMVFVTIKTDITSPRGLAITEEQDVVYREAPAPGTPPQPPQPAPGKAVWSRVVTPDPVMLFRYSALTFNGHRIHYDKPYVTQTEGYPDLIMNGGLTTLLVFELARTRASTPMRHITSRNVRALFVNQPITFGGEPSADNKSAKLWALNADGALALTAEAEFR